MTSNYTQEFNNAINFYKNGQYNEASYILKALINAYPDKAEALFLLGKIEGDYFHNIKVAIEIISKAINIIPFYEGYKELACLYKKENDLINALKFAKLALIYNNQSAEMIEFLKQFPQARNFLKEYEIVIKGEYKTSKEFKQLKYTKIYDEATIKRKAPIFIEELLSEKQKKKLEYAIKQTETCNYLEGFVIKIPDGRAYLKQSDQTFIITPDNKILKDMLVEGCPERTCDTFHNEVRIGEKLLVLSSCWGGNFYHWLTWTVPRLEMIKKAGYSLKEFDKIAINYHGFKFQRELLEILGIPKDKIIATPPYGTILRAKSLVTASLPSHLQTPPIVTESLRTMFLKEEYIDESFPKKIYISRNKSTSRFVLNEDKLFEYLKNLGFIFIYPEDFSFEQQVKIFANADFIISQHGAALLNLCFCKPNTKIIEIYNENFRENIDTGYFRITNNVNLDHYFMFGEPIGENENTNMIIDLDKLAKTIELANSKTRQTVPD